MCEETNGDIQAQLKQHDDSTRSLGWTSLHERPDDLTTTHNIDYATMSVSFLPLTLNVLVRLSVATRRFSGTHVASYNWTFVKEVRGDMF